MCKRCIQQRLDLHFCIIIVMILQWGFTTVCALGEKIEGHYCSTYGDNESLVEARKTARELAIQNAVRSYRTFVDSIRRVENGTLKKDIVNAVTLGYLKDINVIDKSENGRTVCRTISADLSADELSALFENLAMDHVKKWPNPSTDQQMPDQEALRLSKLFLQNALLRRLGKVIPKEKLAILAQNPTYRISLDLERIILSTITNDAKLKKQYAHLKEAVDPHTPTARFMTRIFIKKSFGDLKEGNIGSRTPTRFWKRGSRRYGLTS